MTKNQITVFLGGDCSDGNEWRAKLTRQYNDGSFYFIDPYDPDWDPETNIYTEIADMINSDLILFYKGGEGTDKEKQLLKDIDINFQEFDDLDSLMAFLDEIKKDPDLVLNTVAETPYPSTTDTEANAQTGGSTPYAVNYTLQSKHSSAIAKAIATIKLPIEIGDEILTGHWKNHKEKVKSIGVDKYNQPTANNRPLLNIRIPELMDSKKEASAIAKTASTDFSVGQHLYRGAPSSDLGKGVYQGTWFATEPENAKEYGTVWEYEATSPLKLLNNSNPTKADKVEINRIQKDYFSLFPEEKEKIKQGNPDDLWMFPTPDFVNLIEENDYDGYMLYNYGLFIISYSWDKIKAVGKAKEVVAKTASTPQTETPEFKAWFGDSKVVDEEGEPLVVYHSTDNTFTVFDKDQLGMYALNNVSASQFIEESISLGHDGIIIEKDNEFGGMSYIVFNSNQIKSAIDNKGTFDLHNPDITASKISTASIRTLLCTTATTLKGWITPDGEFVHIGDKNHYEYIGELLKEAIDAAGISATGSYSDFAMSRGWIRTTGGYEDTFIVELNDSATAKGIQTAISYIKDAFNSEALVYVYVNNVEHKISDKSELACVLQKLNAMPGSMMRESSAIAVTKTIMAALEYKHGCIEIPVPAYIRSYFLKEILAERLSVEDLNQDESVFGIEPDTHITYLFGIDDQDKAVAKLKKLFTKPLHIKTSDVDYFDNDDSSVAYVSLECPELTELHYALAKNLDVKDTHPEYIPHITLAYVNKGKRLSDDKVKSFEWDCNTIVVSSKDGHLVSVCCTPELNGNVLVQELVDPTAKQ